MWPFVKILQKSSFACFHFQVGHPIIERHISRKVHQSRSIQDESNHRITESFVSDGDRMALKVIGAEVKFTEFLLEHNLPIATADHAGPLF